MDNKKIENNIDNEMIKKAVNLALREYKKGEREEQKQRILHDTKLLMKYYNSLKLHAENAIYNSDMLEVDEDDERDRIYILSIRRTKLRTLAIVAHIEMAMEELKKKKLEDGAYEQYRAFVMYYIDKKCYDEIQKELNCSKNTPARWINTSIKDLSILLFGIDGLKLSWVG